MTQFLAYLQTKLFLCKQWCLILSDVGPFTVYTANDRDLKVFCGDVFDLNASFAGPFDAIWDCNAIVAINIEDRGRYVKLLMDITKQSAPILMTTWVYEQSIHIRRPFSMPPEMVEELFATYCDTRLVENIVVPKESNFCHRHELPWATRPVLLLNRK